MAAALRSSSVGQANSGSWAASTSSYTWTSGPAARSAPRSAEAASGPATSTWRTVVISPRWAASASTSEASTMITSSSAWLAM